MSKVSKQRKEALAKFDKSKSYSLNEAVDIVKQITYSKFDASVDLNIRLGLAFLTDDETGVSIPNTQAISLGLLLGQ